MYAQNMIGKDFGNIAQRMIYGVLASRPDFLPVRIKDVTSESQKQMYDFISDITVGIYENSDLMKITPAPDDSYADWQVNNRKPNLIKLMRKTQRSAIKLYTLIYEIGFLGCVDGNSLVVAKSDIKIPKSSLDILETFGVENKRQKEQVIFTSRKYPSIFPGWKLLSKSCSESDSDTMFLFSRGIFGDQPDFLINMLAAFDPATERHIIDFDKYLQGSGYRVKKEEGWEIWGLVYFKDDERRFSIQYDVRKHNQMHYNLRLNRFKEFWQRFTTLDSNTRGLLVEMTKECNNCGLCRKIGIKAMGPFSVQIEGKNKQLCPWYPRSEWRHIDSSRISGIRTLLELQDEILHSES